VAALAAGVATVAEHERITTRGPWLLPAARAKDRRNCRCVACADAAASHRLGPLDKKRSPAGEGRRLRGLVKGNIETPKSSPMIIAGRWQKISNCVWLERETRPSAGLFVKSGSTLPRLAADSRWRSGASICLLPFAQTPKSQSATVLGTNAYIGNLSAAASTATSTLSASASASSAN